jgi:phosphohistidine phosphatase
VVEDHRLYLASPESLINVLRETPAGEQSVALVAHNPGLTELVNLLAGTPVIENLPTLGVARFAVSVPWAELRYGSAVVECITSPKRLAAPDA